MKLEKIKEFKEEEFSMFASLPDMGSEGGLVSWFLAQNLKCEQYAEVKGRDKP